ncbi:hypothetical protein V0R37_18860 [Pollutimonas sp. H1-120]|uniref:hypothetical protein n=1 Tax=Pollutimonas sp. H1-120 TaxID=3148824 RepID=UPI003B52C224
MAEVKLKVTKPIEILNTDSEIIVSNNKDGKIGTLKISRGGIEWLPRGHSANAHKCTWEKLAEVLEANVSKKRIKKD